MANIWVFTVLFIQLFSISENAPHKTFGKKSTVGVNSVQSAISGRREGVRWILMRDSEGFGESWDLSRNRKDREDSGSN